MEEQRARQEREAQSAVEKTAAETAPAAAGTGNLSFQLPTGLGVELWVMRAFWTDTNEEAMLAQALAMSVGGNMEEKAPAPAAADDNLAAMTEEEQIAFALRLSMQPASEDTMEVDSKDDGTSIDVRGVK